MCCPGNILLKLVTNDQRLNLWVCLFSVPAKENNQGRPLRQKLIVRTTDLKFYGDVKSNARPLKLPGAYGFFLTRIWRGVE